MAQSDVFQQGEQYIKAFYDGEIDTPERLVQALDNKWFRLNTLYKIKPKPPDEEDDSSAEEAFQPIVPFQPNWAQRDFWSKKHNRNLILKARQFGFTTLEMIDSLDTSLFTPHSNIGIIAHTKGDATSIFNDKIKVAYECVPEYWLEMFDEVGLLWPTPVVDQAGGYRFSNGSKLDVSVSYRGGTLKKLHVSEFGSICKNNPLAAEEIVSGAFEAVPLKGGLTIESTAEGREGYFYEYSQTALKNALSGKKPGLLDFKIFFYPWFKCPDYFLDDDEVIVTEDMKEYFDAVEAKTKQMLTLPQKKWYIKKQETLKDKMKSQYPSTPEEAFEGSTQGAYYAKQMNALRKKGQIRHIPHDFRLPVYTFWDLGRRDSTAIWFMQYVWGEYRLIRYYENSGENIQFYCREIRKFEYDLSTVYLPHDGDVVDYSSGDNRSRKEIVQAMGFPVEVVTRVPDKLEAIQAVRDILPMCWFDEALCEKGILALESFRKEWDAKLGKWKDKPLHDWASHGASAFEQLARGFTATDGQQMSYEPEVV